MENQFTTAQFSNTELEIEPIQHKLIIIRVTSHILFYKTMF
jgi:hypothetical protein